MFCVSGKVVSGYRVRNGQWTQIGRQSPLLPQVHPQMHCVLTEEGLVHREGLVWINAAYTFKTVKYCKTKFACSWLFISLTYLDSFLLWTVMLWTDKYKLTFITIAIANVNYGSVTIKNILP